MKIKKDKIISILLIVLQMFFISSSVFAVNIENDEESVLVQAKESLAHIGVNYWGQDITGHYTVYNDEYPAYCVNYYKGGVKPDKNYSVKISGNYIDENITGVTKDKKLAVWRVIKNGYPYKTIVGLDKLESYVATKLAIFYVLEDWETSGDPGDKVIGTNDEGRKVINAMYDIVNAAKLSEEIPIDPKLNLTQTDWKIDEIDNKFLSKKITLDCTVEFSEFCVNLEGNVPNGTIITDLKNNNLKEFKNCKEFKILVPLEYLIENGNFTINVAAKVPAYPLIFGVAPSTNLQNYVLTGALSKLEPEKTQITYPKNETKIIINKQDGDGTILPNVKFNLLNFNKEIVYENLETNENGVIEINNLVPGLYYLQEVETIEGYEFNSDLIELNVDLNETKEVTVENNKIPDKPEEPVMPEVPETPEEPVKPEMPKLPRTGW